MTGSNATVPLAWHFDLHTPGSVRVNENPDVRGIARALKKAGVEEIITFAKCHFGYAYYPTKIGTPHPRMEGDAFGGVLSACRAKGIRVLAYISFGLDGQAGERHPEWCQLNKDGKGDPPGGFIRVCPFTKYLDELMLPQIAEVIENYRPDGFWFDTMSALSSCYCAICRESFRTATGAEVPVEENDPLQASFGRWRHDRGLAMVKRVADFVQERLSGAIVGFNQLGGLPYPEKMPEGMTVLTLDPPTYGPQSLQFSLNAGFGASTGQRCDVMPTIFNQGWGDWSLATMGRIEQVAAAIWARGARLYMGDRLHPEIRLTRTSQEALEAIQTLRRRVQQWFPDGNAAPSPDIIIVHNVSVTYGEDWRWFGSSDGRERLGQVSGAHRLFLDCGSNFAVTAEDYLTRWLDRVGLVVLPELPSIYAETETQLRNYVERGGRLLLVGSIPMVRGHALDWVGVQSDPEPWQDHIYVPAWPGDSDELETLVRGEFHKIQLHGATCVMRAIPAYDAQWGVRYGWGIGPPCEQPSSYPVLTRSKLGKGEVWHFGGKIFSDYDRNGNRQQVRWWSRLLREMASASRAWLDSPHGSVELVLWENTKSTWAILIQHGGEQLFGNWRPWARTVGPAPRTEVVLHLRCAPREPAQIVVARRKLAWNTKGDSVTVPIRLNSFWQVVRVDWQ